MTKKFVSFWNYGWGNIREMKTLATKNHVFGNIANLMPESPAKKLTLKLIPDPKQK